ncbi:MAG: TIR domain-containing protein [Acaryochloris sp. RU_4_1]|nr:TIR domain-containing protein [Acaryochloris sp. RU_4_1]
MGHPSEFDVFLCHNSEDKPEVEKIAHQLKSIGLTPWLDKWELPPGRPWRRILEEQIGQVRSAAVFVGSNGQGPWQELEIDALLNEFARRECPVIPVLLRNAPIKPNLPLFLNGIGWVDFRQQDSDPIALLHWGITGQKPDFSEAVTRAEIISNSNLMASQYLHEKQQSKLIQLQNFLVSHQWKDADQQTKEIILAVNDDKNLSVPDIRKLPSELLQQIDTLWLQHSNSRFGLSIQKRVWESSQQTPKVLGFLTQKNNG